jgi:hypothetical protein
MPDRRSFLKLSSLAAAGLLLQRHPLATGPAVQRPSFRPVRIRGKVTLGGRGLGRAAVSDGLSVVATRPDGEFELISDGRRPFLQLSLPGGCRIPQNGTCTADFYRPIRPYRRGEMTARFDLEAATPGTDVTSFIVMADPQVQDDEDLRQYFGDMVPHLKRTIDGLDAAPRFAITCGDIVFDRVNLFADYERSVKELGIPFFQVLGNHDVDLDAATDELSTASFRRHFGPAWYSFELGEIHCVVLDSVFWHGRSYIGYLTQDHLDWLSRDLALVEAGRTVVLFTHIPPYNSRQERFTGTRSSTTIHLTNRQALYRLLEPYRATVVCGHMHECEYLRDGGVDIHILGAACGAWWTGSVCIDGTPPGYAVYEARGADLRWRYVDGTSSEDRQIRIYPPGMMAQFPGELAANVWGADDAWRITWYENGSRRGVMTRRRAVDPLALGLYEGPQKPARRTWVEPVATDHLYFARPSAAAREITVEATDRWGGVHTARLELAALTGTNAELLFSSR